MIIDIADKMLDTIIYDNDIRLPDGDYYVWREKLVRLLGPAYDKLGEDFFTDELIDDFCIGEDSDMERIVNENPVLRPVHDLLNEFFEEAGDYDINMVAYKDVLKNTNMDVGDQEAFDKFCEEANKHIEDYV